MQKLFEDWKWGALSIHNAVSVKTEKSFHASKNRGNTSSYQLGIKFTGRTELCYKKERIDYTAGTVVYLPKENTDSIDYTISTSEGGNGVCIFFDSDVPLSSEVQVMHSVNSEVEDAFLRVLKLYSGRHPYPEVMEAFYGLLSRLLAMSEASTRVTDPEKLMPAIKYMEENLTSPYLDIKRMAVACAMTEKYFRDNFKRVMGSPPLAYFSELKMLYARECVADLSLSVADVAKKCGFRDANYFSRFFKKHTGISPCEYRNYYCKKI